jgi:hypothetical protein
VWDLTETKWDPIFSGKTAEIWKERKEGGFIKGEGGGKVGRPGVLLFQTHPTINPYLIGIF